MFQTIPDIASIPYEQNRITNISGSAKRKEFVLDSSLLDKINMFCTKHNISSYNFFMSIYAIYLGKICHLNNFAIATPVLNRTGFAEKNTTGMFINTVPLKISLDGNYTFIDFVKSISTNSIGMLRHQKYTYQQLLSDLRKKDNSLPGLYDFMLSYQVTKANDKSSAIPYDVNWLPTSTISEGICVHLHDNNDSNLLNLDYDYQTDKYDENDIKNMHSRILNIIEQIFFNDSITLNEIEIITPLEKVHILNDFNNTQAYYPKEKTIAQLFDEQVLKTPNNIAVIFNDQSLTYKELNKKANSLAFYLRNNGIKRNDLVGIMVNRSIEMIVSILAVLKAGGAYIPIDPTYPQNRIDYMLNSSNAKILLTQTHLNNKVDFKNKLFIDLNNTNIYNLPSSNLANISTPEDLAYVIFTSGSTGIPKGVMLMQKNIVNFIFGMMKEFSFSTKNTIVSITTMSFDIFVLESLLPLLNGMKVVIANEDEQTNVNLFNKLCVKYDVDIVQTTPSRFMAFLVDNQHLDFVKNATHILIGGEPFPTALLKKFKEITKAKIYNMYGPTETAVWSSLKDLSNSAEINIGVPISNTKFYILDENLHPMPPYAPGEIYISGDGVCKGYLNNKEITKKSFIKNPFNSNTIMYKTGDIGMYSNDGEIICLGRSDSQVKIRGLRLELGEIEDKISEIPEIISCAVVKWINENSHEYLCAYYTSNAMIDSSKIRKHLGEFLPTYMIPEYYMQVSSLPFTPNGKINRKALPQPQINSTRNDIVQPRNDIDSKLVSMFKETLNCDNISITDSFFELGGDSLSAISLSIKIQNTFKCKIYVKDILEHSNVKEISDLIANNKNIIDTLTIPKIKDNEYYPVSFAQKRMYFASQASGTNSTLYNISGGVLLDGIIDVDLLEKCFKILINRHESLRTSFEINNKTVVQKINNVDFKLDIIKAADIKYIDNISKDFIKPFDLNKAPLLRARFIQFINGKSALFLDMHHIISDGKSLNILIDELCKLYNGETLPELNIAYKDFAVFENQIINNGKLKDAEEFWLHKFEGEIPVLNMPTNFSRPAVKVYDGKKIHLNIDKNLTKKIHSISNELGITPYMLLLSCYYILLSKYTSQNDIVIGSPIIGREYHQTNNLIGMFVNTLALKEHIDSSYSLKEFMLSLKEDLLEYYKYQAYPFDKLVEMLNIKRDTSRNPLFDTMFVYQNEGYKGVSFGNINSEYYIPDTNISKFDLTLEALPNNEEISLTFEYSTELFNNRFIKSLSEHYLNVLNNIIEDTDKKISDIEIISDEEKNQILYDFNNTAREYPKNKTVIELFEDQVQANPNNIALVFEHQQLSYKELNEKANSLANYLILNGVNKKEVISIFLDKSIESIVAILAILKCGCPYMPIDINYPDKRIKYMIDSSNSKLILTTKNEKAKLTNFSDILCIDLDNKEIYSKSTENIKISSSPDELAYIMYTSGSTGTPKGVMVQNRNIVRLVKNTNFIKFKNHERFLQTGSIVFDACTFEIWGSLLNGFELYIIKKEDLLDPLVLEKYLKDNKITILWLTAPLFNQLSENNPKMFQTVRVLLTGGDVLSPKHINLVRKACPNITIINGYGPTENTTFSTCYTIDKNYETSIPIGFPIANSTCYIVSSDLGLVPVDVPGELLVGGDGVSKGYLNNNDQTKLKFIPNKFGDGLLYRTGDLVKWNNDGSIDFIGRIDNQVKIRGFRVELEEITLKIQEYKNIKECYTIIRNINNENVICTYFSAKEDIDISLLKEFLKKSLPSYSIPTYFSQLSALPINANGKVDKNSLPEPIKEITRKTILPPRNENDIKLIEILKKILNVHSISIDDSFFDLGGDSLSAINLCVEIQNVYNTEIFVKDILQNPTIQELSDKISKVSISKNKNTISPIDKADFYPISTAQKRMYYTSQLAGESSVLYNIPEGIIFNTKVDIKKLEDCINIIINRHETLRTYFEPYNDTIVQKIDENIKFNLEVIKAADYKYLDSIFKDFVRPFDLGKAPLFRAKFIEFTNGKSVLFIDIHHIVFDGKSISIFTDELSKLYNGIPLPELLITYKDYSAFESDKLSSGNLKEAEDFWINKFSGEIPVLDMPTSYPRPAIQSFEGKKILKLINNELSKQIETLSRSLNVTPYMLLLSAYYILLSKYTSNEDIVVGSPVVGRDIVETYNMIGMFVNTLAIRQTVDSNLSFKDFVLQVKENLVNSYRYQTYPFDELVNKLNIKRDTSRNPLFDTMFIYQNNGFKKLELEGSKVEYYEPDTNTSKFDLSVEAVPNDNGIMLSFEYATNLFSEHFIDDLSKHYLNILNNIIKSVDTKISDINILSDEEEKHILYDLNDTFVKYLKSKTVAQLFEEQAHKTPDNIAVICGEKRITYKELNEKSNSLAFFLREAGIGRNNLVGIMVNRSIEMIIAILAVLKSGGAYIPIDPTFPQDRIEYMLNNSNAKILLTQNKLKNKINFENKIYIDLANKSIYSYPKNNLENINKPEDLFYVIFTSGSTGRPKGVMIMHKTLSNFTNYCNNYIEYLKNPSYDTILSITTISFDIFAFETIISLQRGLKVVIATEDEQTTPSLLNHLIEKNNVTITQSTPSVMQLFINNIDDIPLLKNLKYITLSGEPLSIDLVHKLHKLSNVTIYNGYGPSETYYVTFTKMNDEIITIGKPLDNTQIYILDKYLHPVPIGATGELYMSGDCVAKGYLNNEELTNKSFITNPFIDGTIMYKSGDLGKYTDDGNILCLGRLDHQIKIRGQRIELGEIESLISKYPNIENVTVVKQIIQTRECISAYYISNKRISTNELRKYLSSALPRYMVPSYFVALDEFPYTPNGKVDKKALPLPKEILTIREDDYIAPKTALQKKLATIWEKVLNTSPIGINDNFFELGGDSILAMSLNIELLKITDRISYSDIFRFSTIAEQADKITSNDDVPIFSKIENLSSGFVDILNNCTKKDTIRTHHPKNILLTGATGFLGIHILEQYIINESCNIYCIIRDEPGISAKKKLYQKLNYYFGNKYDDLIDKRIFALTGNISSPGFGLQQDELLNLANSIDIVINSAARVAHYGKYNDFYNSNVRSIRYMIDFCNSFNKTLYHISTIGISDLKLDTSMLSSKKKTWWRRNINNEIIFDESSLYIGQNLNNVYTRSKFEAESYVLDAISNGLDGYILRMGNLMPRFKDGVFQENVQDNSFVNKLAAFINIGIIPEYLLKSQLEFTPIDYAGKAVYTLITHPSDKNRIFHVYNHKTISILRYLKLLKKQNYSVKILNELDFKNKINEIIQDDNSHNLLNNLLNDFNNNLQLEYKSDIIIKSNFTINYLNRFNFRWPKITNKYLIKFINILKKVM